MSSCQPRDLMNVEEFKTEADFMCSDKQNIHNCIFMLNTDHFTFNSAE